MGSTPADPPRTDMMFVLRQLQEPGVRGGMSLSMCFIDLHKAYDITSYRRH